MDFKQTQQAYIHLKDQFEQGRITADDFETRVNEMVVTDSAGDQWQIGVKTGKWYRFADQTWMEDIPQEFKRTSTLAPAPAVYVPPIPSTYQNQSGKNTWLSGCLIAGGVGLCCLTMGVGGWLAWNYNPSPVPLDVPTISLSAIPSVAPLIPSVTAVAPSTASPEPVAGPGFDPDLVQFQDDFSNPDSGWDDIRVGEDFNTLYFDDSYLFVITSADFYAWANLHKDFSSDVQVEVDARKTSGSQNDGYGLLCRYDENSDGTSSYYYFAITIYGAGLVYKVDHDEALIITSPQMEMSGIVLPGNQVNRMRADCVGDTLTLYVNGQFLNSTTDSSLNGGNVGLRVDSETGETEIRFDNFIVFKPGY